jgi:hypothetical protein
MSGSGTGTPASLQLTSAPRGEFAEISDFVQSTSTVTLLASMSSAIAAGHLYAIADDTVPLQVLIQMINRAVEELRIPEIDKTSLTTVSGQTEYTLPVEAHNLRQVHVALNDDANENSWAEINNWYIQLTAAGSDPTLVLPYSIDSDYVLRLTYVRRHPELLEETDYLHDAIPPELVIFPAVQYCYEWLRSRRRSKEYDQEIAEWGRRADIARAERRMRLPRKRGYIGMIGIGSPDLDSDVNKVSL